MATAGCQDTSSDEDTTSEEEDFDQYIDDDWFVATKLQKLVDDPLFIDEQPGTSSQQKAKNPSVAKFITSSELAGTSANVTTFDATILQRNPKIKSTPLSMKFVRDLLMSKHGVEREAAQAAVQSRGCDIDLCLHWIERNSFNFTLLEEKSKEFEFKSGLTTDAEMMEWTVRHLTTAHGVVEELARATVLIKGYKNLGECKKYAMNPDEKIISMLDPTEDFHKKIEGLREEQKTVAEDACEGQKYGSITRKLLEAYGVEGNFVKTVGIAELSGFDCFYEWILRNQYDEEKQEKLCNILPSDVLEKQNLCQLLEKIFGQDFLQVASEMYMALFRQDFKAGTISDIIFRSDHDSFYRPDNQSYLQQLQEDFSKYPTVVHATGFVLSDFMSEMMAKAAVQASGANLDRCLEWAKKNVYHDIVETMALQYEGNLQRFITICNLVKFIASETRLRWPDMDVISWYKLCRRVAEWSLEATSSTDFELCLEWIKNRKLQASKEKRAVELMTVCLQSMLEAKSLILSDEEILLYISQAEAKSWRTAKREFRIRLFGADFQDFNAPGRYKTACKMIVMAAIEATSSTDFDVCQRWMSESAKSIDEVSYLQQQFKRNRVLGLRKLLEGFTQLDYDYIIMPTPEFLQISALKTEKKQKMGPGGGEINLQECSVIFPEGALKEEKDFSMFLNNDPKQFPSFTIPITSILGCRPSVDFEKPVTVRMKTCYSAIGNAEITAALYQRRDENAIWAEVQKVTLINRNEVQFDVMHFSDDVVGISDGATGGEFHLINDVYIKKDTSTIASIFFIDQGAYDLATADMQRRGVVPLLMKAKKIIAKMGVEIKIAMQCSRPEGMEATSYNNPLLKVTPEYIKRREHEIYFELDHIPQDYNGKFLIKYTLKIGDEEETLPLTASWPIVIPEKPVLQIRKVSIDSRTSIRGNIVSAGDATTSIESHNPVYHIGNE